VNKECSTTTTMHECPNCHELVEMEPVPMLFAILDDKGNLLMTEKMHEQLAVCGYRLERIQ